MMILLSAIDVQLTNILVIGLIIIIASMILRYFRQPYVIAYILAGVLIGKHGMQMVTDEETARMLGEFGLILLFFFIGMEISLPHLVKNWKVPTLGTLFQILGSIFLVGLIGYYFDWSVQRIVILGFITSLSSSAVVIKLLQDSGESQIQIGQSVISILLMQDVLIVPMLIMTTYLGGNSASSEEIILQIIGGILIIGVMYWVYHKQSFKVPFAKKLRADHELQVFLAAIVCFGFAVVTAFFGLSAALGAFVGGIVVHATQATEWFHDSLHSFRVVFVAIFFVSIGMMIDMEFLVANWEIISLIILAVYIGNHFINAAVLHYFGRNWANSLYGGALLGQVGELSFLLAVTAFYSNVISDFEYKITVIVISMTLFISPFWIAITKRILHYKAPGEIT
ncbi:MAG: cation:proton antiporter [Bacteroidia bacterium]|nr:cation:proton antiporter [Bacteroidia bacterium]